MRQILMSTAIALALAGAAHAQVSTSTSTNADTGVRVGNGASTVRVDGNSTIRTFGDGTTSITRPANDAVDNTRLGTEVNTRAKVRNSVDSGARVNTRGSVSTNPQRMYDPATGVTKTVNDAAGGVTGSVADTIKSPLGSNGVSVGTRTTTSGSVGN